MSRKSSLQRESLECFVSAIFKMVAEGATEEQWAEWLRVPMEHSAKGNHDPGNLFNALMGAREAGSAPGRRRLNGCDGRASEIFDLVWKGATAEDWGEWLRVPLEYAAAEGSAVLFNALMAAGADGSAGWRGNGRRTLLHAAALGGSADVTSGLLDAGAAPDINVVDSNEVSALYLATSGGHEEAARLLVKAGADVNSPGPDVSILSAAAENECEELVDDLLQAGANPNAEEDEDPERIALHLAVASHSDRMVLALCAKGANVSALNLVGESPLIHAAIYGDTAVAKALLDYGANTNTRNPGDDNRNALDVAARHGNVGIINVLLGYGADVNAVADDDAATALHCAAECYTAWVRDAVEALVESGANIEAKNWLGLTPLAYAAQLNNCQAMRVLLRHGANVGVEDLDGNTPLHLACNNDRLTGDAGDAVDFLLRLGADEKAVNRGKQTPIQVLETKNPNKRPCGFKRARWLLARATNDRAWRRRCWLVMLRSRASKASPAGCDTDDGSGDGASRGVRLNVADGRGAGGGSETARTDNAGGDKGCLPGLVSAVFVSGAGENPGSFRTAVSSLIELELEGLFRMVVGFL